MLLLRFLKAMEVREKKMAREQKKECEQKNDQAGEELFAYG